jgi:hypothetical protein
MDFSAVVDRLKKEKMDLDSISRNGEKTTVWNGAKRTLPGN